MILIIVIFIGEKDFIQSHLEELKVPYSILKKHGEVNHVFSHINMTYVVYTANLETVSTFNIYKDISFNCRCYTKL